MARNTPLAPMMGPDAVAPRGGTTIRSPKTAELVAGTLRRMVVDGQLKEGDFLPNEAELMTHFGVSRPTLREAVRVLESERLVEVRRGSRTGARVRVPGPEIVARPAGRVRQHGDHHEDRGQRQQPVGALPRHLDHQRVHRHKAATRHASYIEVNRD